MSFPNQKMYHIKKKVEEGDIFLMLKWEDCVKAGRELKGAAFNLYLYLAKNKDGYNLHFSTEDFMQTYGVSEKTYRNARDKLFEKGYLKEGDKNHVYFDAAGGFKDTREGLREQIQSIYGRLNLADESRALKLKEEIFEAQLNKIKEDSLYIIKAKEIIAFGEELLNDVSRSEIEGLL